MKISTKPSNQAGFTLVEVILYVGIFSLIIGGIVGLATLSTAERVKNQNRADLDYQGQALMAMITKTIRQATSVTSPSPGDSDSTLTLSMFDPRIDPTNFDTQSQSGYNAAEIRQGNPEVSSLLTNSRITVSNLKFSNMSVGGTANSIMVQFDLTYRNQLARPEFDYTETFRGGATIP
jgi:type II secretory pathway pseudopilin PulG